MTESELQRLLDDALVYELCADSLKDLNNDEGLDNLTESVMQLRVNINKITNKNVRMCMILRYINRWRYKDIAKKMKVSYQWVYELHNKGIKNLLEIYNQG